jgi:hypothetical protein
MRGIKADKKQNYFAFLISEKQPEFVMFNGLKYPPSYSWEDITNA